MPGNLTSASWASVWDGTAQKIWCVVNLNDMDSVLRPQLVQENRHILAYLCSSLLLGGRTNRLTTIKSTAHIWLENVAFYTESNKSVVGLVPISHMDLFKHAPIHISPIRVYKKSLCSTLSPSNPSLYLPTTCRDIFLSLITLRSLRLQFMLCSSPLGEENYLWTFWLTLWPLEPTFWSLFQLVSIFWLALNFLLYLWPPQWSFFLIVVYSDWPWLSCCSLSHITLCDSVNSMPAFPVLHYFPKFAQTHVHWVDDAIQPSHPLLSPFLLPSDFPRIKVFSSMAELAFP